MDTAEENVQQRLRATPLPELAKALRNVAAKCADYSNHYDPCAEQAGRILAAAVAQGFMLDRLDFATAVVPLVDKSFKRFACAAGCYVHEHYRDFGLQSPPRSSGRWEIVDCMPILAALMEQSAGTTQGPAGNPAAQGTKPGTETPSGAVEPKRSEDQVQSRTGATPQVGRSWEPRMLQSVREQAELRLAEALEKHTEALTRTAVPAGGAASMAPAGGTAVGAANPPKAGEIAPKRRIREPKQIQKNIAAFYEASDLTQTEAATLLTQKLTMPISQDRVSRAVRAVNRWRRLNPDLRLPQIPTRKRRVTRAVDPHVLSAGQRRDGLSQRQRASAARKRKESE